MILLMIVILLYYITNFKVLYYFAWVIGIGYLGLLAFITLANACGKVLANRNLYPEDINGIAYRYLFTGCKSRYEYEYLVNFLIDNTSIREELLK